MKDELGGKVMTKFVGLRASTHIHLIAEGNEDKNAKGIEKHIIKSNLNLKIIKIVSKQLNLKIKKIRK